MPVGCATCSHAVSATHIVSQIEEEHPVTHPGLGQASPPRRPKPTTVRDFLLGVGLPPDKLFPDDR